MDRQTLRYALHKQWAGPVRSSQLPPELFQQHREYVIFFARTRLLKCDKSPALCFAAKGSVLVVALRNRIRNEVGFYDLARPDRVPQRAPGGFFDNALAVSPDGGLASAFERGGQVLLLDPAMGKLIDSLHGHRITAIGSAFSPDGRRLFSIHGGQEAVRLWDVGTRQELLTLTGMDSPLHGARWSADGDVILAGPPWQAWTAPSWKEIAAAEAKEKTESKKP